jgi:hypothetical protein
VRGDFGVLGPGLDSRPDACPPHIKTSSLLASSCLLALISTGHFSLSSLSLPHLLYRAWLGLGLSLSLSLSCSGKWYGGIASQPSQPPSLSIVSLCVHIIILHCTPTLHRLQVHMADTKGMIGSLGAARPGPSDAATK